MHNESLADQVVDGTVSENGSKPSNVSALGVEVHMSPLVTKVAIGAAALLAGAYLGNKLNARSIAVQSASKIQDVAEQAEEAAARR
jgi:hypothetical protein